VIAIPALDLRRGACVQVAPHSYDHELIRIPDPVGVATAWRQYGFQHLHVVDLDAVAGGKIDNRTIDAILNATDAEVQVGGGIRTQDAIESLLEERAQRVVIGTRALEDIDWIADMSSIFPGRIVVATDVRDRKVLSHGWTRTHSKSVLDVLDELNDLPLAGVLVTAVHREQDMAGADLPLIEDIVESAEFPVFAAGGLATLADLRALAERGVFAAILGIALYAGVLDPRMVADEFGE
jgi:phosphoribosylformimino-5-aminoimidazole carboxamide ribotide isomerase